MSISANSGGLWGNNRAIFCLENYLHKPIHVWSKKHCVIYFRVGDDFTRNNTLQLLYHNDMVNARNGHYEPIIFTMPHGKKTKTCYHKQNIPTNQQQCPLNNEVKNSLYICMEFMIICTHKNKILKYHMKM
jgi:hypothetical protein